MISSCITRFWMDETSGQTCTVLKGGAQGSRRPRGSWSVGLGRGRGEHVRTARTVGELRAQRCGVADGGVRARRLLPSFPPSLLERAWRLPLAVSRAGGCEPGIGCSAPVDARAWPRFAVSGARLTAASGLRSTTANNPRGVSWLRASADPPAKGTTAGQQYGARSTGAV